MYKYILKHTDKLLHFSLSYFLVTFLYVLPIATPLYSVVVLVAMLGLAKEVYDEKKFDKYDLLADGIGIIFGVFVIITMA